MNSVHILEFFFFFFFFFGVHLNIILVTMPTSHLLKLNRDQLRWLVGLFTGHYHLRHPFKLGLADDPASERCLEEDESATHILYGCEAIAYLRFRHLGQFIVEPSDYYDSPIKSYISFEV
jgi:hypothetical protein